MIENKEVFFNKFTKVLPGHPENKTKILKNLVYILIIFQDAIAKCIDIL